MVKRKKIKDVKEVAAKIKLTREINPYHQKKEKNKWQKKIEEKVKETPKKEEIKPNKEINKQVTTEEVEEYFEEANDQNIVAPVIPINETTQQPRENLESTADLAPIQETKSMPQRAAYNASEISYSGSKDYSTGTINREGRYDPVESSSSMFIAGQNPAMSLVSSPFVSRDIRAQPREMQQQDVDHSDLERFTKQQEKYQAQMEARRKPPFQHKNNETEIF